MTGRIRRAAAMALGLALVLAMSWFGVAPASAGGPTSVLMVSPGSGRAAALHYENPRYDQLVRAVDAYAPAAGQSSRPPAVTDCFDCEIRLTWLIHDMQVWRVDRVHLTPEDGIWVESVADDSGGDIFDRAARWHRPHDPATLLAVLAASGLRAPAEGARTGDSSTDDASTGTASTDDASTEEPVAVGAAEPDGRPAVSEAAAPTDVPTSLVAALAGAVGVVAGLGLGWLVRRVRSDRDRFTLVG